MARKPVFAWFGPVSGILTHRPTSQSPALDRGGPQIATGFDQRGLDGAVDIPSLPNAHFSASDMGSVELQASEFVPPSPPNGIIQPTGLTGLRAAALRKCKKKARQRDWPRKKLRKCKRKARALPSSVTGRAQRLAR